MLVFPWVLNLCHEIFITRFSRTSSFLIPDRAGGGLKRLSCEKKFFNLPPARLDFNTVFERPGGDGCSIGCFRRRAVLARTRHRPRWFDPRAWKRKEADRALQHFLYLICLESIQYSCLGNEKFSTYIFTPLLYSSPHISFGEWILQGGQRNSIRRVPVRSSPEVQQSDTKRPLFSRNVGKIAQRAAGDG